MKRYKHSRAIYVTEGQIHQSTALVNVLVSAQKLSQYKQIAPKGKESPKTPTREHQGRMSPKKNKQQTRSPLLNIIRKQVNTLSLSLKPPPCFLKSFIKLQDETSIWTKQTPPPPQNKTNKQKNMWDSSVSLNLPLMHHLVCYIHSYTLTCHSIIKSAFGVGVACGSHL